MYYFKMKVNKNIGVDVRNKNAQCHAVTGK